MAKLIKTLYGKEYGRVFSEYSLNNMSDKILSEFMIK